MKIISIAIIVICLILNILVGSALFYFTNMHYELLSIDGVEYLKEDFPEYGFSIGVPADMVYDGYDIKINLLAFFIPPEGALYDEAFEIYVSNDKEDNLTNNEYKIKSKEYYEANYDERNVEYIDGGIKTNVNKIKYYYDVVILSNENGERIKQKGITFYHKDASVTIYWVGTVDGFDKSVSSFDSMIETLELN